MSVYRRLIEASLVVIWMAQAIVLQLDFTPDKIEQGELLKGRGVCDVTNNYMREHYTRVEIAKEVTLANERAIQEDKVKPYTDSYEEYIVIKEESNNLEWRDRVYIEAKSLVGKVHYEWGMKPTMEDWVVECGLDCSGFIEYVYQLADVEYSDCIESTLTITAECEQISYEDLNIGDLGLIEESGSYYENTYGEINYTGDFDMDGEIDSGVELHSNHVGIYMGVDSEGDDIWVHCNRKDNNVVIGKYPDFKYYYRVNVKG